MTKKSGLGQKLYIGGRDVSNDVLALDTIELRRAVDTVTGLDKSAVERIPLKTDGVVGLTAAFNDATDRSHDALSSLPTADVIVMGQTGTALGDRAWGIIAKQIAYPWTRNADGTLRVSPGSFESNGFPGPEWGKSLTAGVRTDTVATNGTGVDFGTGSTSFGLSAYLAWTDFAGTNVTVTIEESSDDGAVDAYAAVTGGAFTQITTDGPNAERIETSLTQTVEQWLRAVTAGTFSDLDFVVVVKRYISANAETG